VVRKGWSPSGIDRIILLQGLDSGSDLIDLRTVVGWIDAVSEDADEAVVEAVLQLDARGLLRLRRRGPSMVVVRTPAGTRVGQRLRSDRRFNFKLALNLAAKEAAR
jgi:hypothetical protein